MSQAELEVLAALVGFLSSGTFVLIGFRMFLNYRAKRLTGGRADGETLEALEAMRRELEGVRVEVGDLHERMDFAERLLTRGRSDDESAPD